MERCQYCYKELSHGEHGFHSACVQKFIDEHEEGLENDYPLPNQQDYLQVEINPDSLPDYKTWFNEHQW